MELWALSNLAKKDDLNEYKLQAGQDKLLAKIRLCDYAEDRGVYQLLVDDLAWVAYDLDKKCEITVVYHASDFIPDGLKISIQELVTELMEKEDMK